MMPARLFIPVLLGVGIACIIGLVIFVNRKRCAAIREKGESLGFRYEKNGSNLFTMLRGRFSLFDQGHSRRASNVLEGSIDEGEIALFDYRFTTGHGKHRTNHHHMAALIRAPGLSYPAIELRPERWHHKIASAVGYQDIDFAQRPDFSKLYLVRSKDEAGARATLSPLFMDYLTAIDKRHNIELTGDCFLFYRARMTLKADRIEGLMREVVEAFQALRGGESGAQFRGESMSA